MNSNLNMVESTREGIGTIQKLFLYNHFEIISFKEGLEYLCRTLFSFFNEEVCILAILQIYAV